MSRLLRRMRLFVVWAGLAVLLAACASGPGPSTAAPDKAPDLFEALPPTSTVAPPPTAAPTTTPAPGAARPAATQGHLNGAGDGQGSGSGGTGAGGKDPRWARSGGDEFTGSEVDLKTWNLYDSPGGFGNGYRRPEAISQSEGLLKITARDDVSGGMAENVGQLYGRWEFRVRTEKGRGFGSAILLWPDSEQWPQDGELDIMEVPGENRDLAHFVAHWADESGSDTVNGKAVPGDFSQWHTFALEWLPDRITWYVDGVKKYENTDKTVIPTKPMHLTIQLDQGPKKDWIMAPDDTTPEEVNLEVDWVRVYKADLPTP